MRWFKEVARSKPVISGMIFGFFAALLSLIPYVSLLEEKIGLGFLFALRGEQAPPDDVVIVNIDRESATRLSLPENPEQWPRRLHAELIRSLNAAGADLIGFNIFFSTPQSEDDAVMVEAMQESGSVVLANYLRLKHLQGDAYIESLVEPPEMLARSALATVPFLLPQGEETDRFLIHYGENSDQPTFPLTLFRLFVLKKLTPEIESLAREIEPKNLYSKQVPAYPFSSSTSFFNELESQIKRQPDLRIRLVQRLRERPLPHDQRIRMLSLIETLSDEKTLYFNHYGAAGGIPHIPYHRLLSAKGGEYNLDLRGKVVLIGFDEDFQSGKSENAFFSPFSAESSLELAATGVANLLNHDYIHPLFGRWSQFTWLLFWGWLLGWLSSKPLRVGVFGIALLSFGYLATAYWLFGTHWLWIPVILPLFWLAPVGMIVCLAGNYLTRSRENRKIHSVISRFIPEQATLSGKHSENDAQWESKVSFGVCLATDAGQYTALAEKMKPMELGELMNDYYDTLFPAVRRNGGWVSDVTGDAMMAIWTIQHSQTDIRVGALRAALEILGAVDSFEIERQIKLPIRMGLHCGEMRVGFVGGKEHGAYRAVGDTVNTSARLEGLNKLLGTRILVSQPLIEGVPGFINRPMGNFMLAGKSNRVSVHELITRVEESSSSLETRIARFAEALALFHSARWQDAAESFEALSREFPEDGPSRFYAKTARANAENSLATPDLADIQVGKPPPGTLAKQ